MPENRIQGWKAICDYLGQSAYRIRRPVAMLHVYGRDD